MNRRGMTGTNEIYSERELNKVSSKNRSSDARTRAVRRPTPDVRSYLSKISFGSYFSRGCYLESSTSTDKMADSKEKKVKKKKKEEGDAPAPAPAAETRSSSKSSSKKAKRSGSNVFSMFSQAQVAEFKEAFQLMDHDKDGIISKSDLRATCDAVGKLANEKELDEMVNEASGPINFTQLLALFGNRMADSGGTDDDDVVVAAFKTFDENGTIDGEKFRHALMTWGDKFTGREVDDAFDAMEIDDNNRIDTQALITLLTAAEKEEGEGEAA